ncbi:hypothetical protein [Blastopirellula marina]|uniref:Uncharacterized protein n=1 Tax=Blastopirellula marina TaxID=124 RepID=A0A2S8GFD8_9BACT|nr:hypothetical protein [Blastopirellula marina]PQO43143.1 hypothetical protein C5Y93_25905 [Blastopirellula marina]
MSSAEDEHEMEERPAENEPPVVVRRSGIAIAAGLAIAFALFDFFISIFWEWLSGPNHPLWIGGSAGLFVVQISLVAFWTVLGPGRLVVRIPWALLAITLMFVTHQAGQATLPHFGPVERDRMMMAGILLFGWLAISLSLAAYRAISRRRLVWRGDTIESSTKFHLRHLIIGTTLVGVILALLNWSGYPIAEITRIDWQVIFVLGVAAFVNLTVTLPAVVVAFRPAASQGVWQLGLAGFCGAVTLGQFILFCMVMGTPPDGGSAFLFLFAMNYAQCFGLVAALMLIRYGGYDLRVVDGVKQEAAQADPPERAVEADPWSSDD